MSHSMVVSRIPHPIPYQGSKRQIAQRIIEHFPRSLNRLIEPFSGSAAISLAAANAGLVEQFILNDINAPLMHLWADILDRPDALIAAYTQLWTEQTDQTRHYYNLVRERFNQTQQPADLLYLLARCVKAAVRYNSKGEFNQSPDHRRRGMRPTGMARQIMGASHLLRGKTRLTSQDYRDTLAQATPADLVYLDPPYQGVCSDYPNGGAAHRDRRYAETILYDGFVEALEDLNRRGISYIISYDGRTGAKTFGRQLPDSLCLQWLEVKAGRSSQATLLGQNHITYESLYLSPALVSRRS